MLFPNTQFFFILSLVIYGLIDGETNININLMWRASDNFDVTENTMTWTVTYSDVIMAYYIHTGHLQAINPWRRMFFITSPS